MRRKLGYAKWRVGEAGKTVLYRTTTPWGQTFVRRFWDDQADMIHDQWGNADHDHQVLSRLLTAFSPRSILDVGFSVTPM